MIYKVLLVYEQTDTSQPPSPPISLWEDYPAMTLMNPKLELRLNAAGSFQFTMTPDHIFYYGIWPLKGTVEVYENDELIWFGRPTQLERTMKNHKPVYCEGALAYFNDSVQRPRILTQPNAAELFRDILATHNEQVPKDRQFQPGTVTVDKTNFEWENSYEESMSSLNSLLKECEGYFIPRRENGVNYLDWLKELPQDDTQPVEFGLNLLDFDRTYTYSDSFTSIFPVGGVPTKLEDEEEEEEEETGTEQPGMTEEETPVFPITIAEVNGGNDILDRPHADEIPEHVFSAIRIVKKVEFPDIYEPAKLLEAAQNYWNRVHYEAISIDATAAEISFLDKSFQPFRLGKKYHVHSEPHQVDEWLAITEMSVTLNTAAKEITMGKARKTLIDALPKEEGWKCQVNGVTVNRGTVNYVVTEPRKESGNP